MSCLGTSLPTTAPSTITISGTAVAPGVSGTTLLAGVSVEAYTAGSGTPVASTTTGSGGTFSLTLSTGGAPIDGYLKLTMAGYTETDYYPATPAAADGNTGYINLLDASAMSYLSYFSGVALDSSACQIFVGVTDCQPQPIAGASCSSSPSAAAVRYLAGGVPSSSATATDTSGAAVLLNVPAGSASVQASYNSNTLRAHSVNCPAGVNVQTYVKP